MAPKNINYHTEVGNALFFIHNCYHAEVGLPPFPVKPQRGSVCMPSTYARQLKTDPFGNFLSSNTFHPRRFISFTLQTHSAVIATKQTSHQIIDSVIHKEDRNWGSKNSKLEVLLGVIVVLKLWHNLLGMKQIHMTVCAGLPPGHSPQQRLFKIDTSFTYSIYIPMSQGHSTFKWCRLPFQETGKAGLHAAFQISCI